MLRSRQVAVSDVAPHRDNVVWLVQRQVANEMPDSPVARRVGVHLFREHRHKPCAASVVSVQYLAMPSVVNVKDRSTCVPADTPPGNEALHRWTASTGRSRKPT